MSTSADFGRGSKRYRYVLLLLSTFGRLKDWEFSSPSTSCSVIFLRTVTHPMRPVDPDLLQDYEYLVWVDSWRSCQAVIFKYVNLLCWA